MQRLHRFAYRRPADAKLLSQFPFRGKLVPGFHRSLVDGFLDLLHDLFIQTRRTHDLVHDILLERSHFALWYDRRTKVNSPKSSCLTRGSSISG